MYDEGGRPHLFSKLRRGEEWTIAERDAGNAAPEVRANPLAPSRICLSATVCQVDGGLA